MNYLLQRGYKWIRNDYLLPIIVDSKINLREYPSMKLKKVILEYPISAEVSPDGEIIFSVPKSYLNKAIISEIEQFFVRASYQKLDYNQLVGNGSGSWKVTTQYYRYFFLANCLQRILNSGFFWINDDEIQYLSTILSSLTGEDHKYEKGNYQFRINEADPEDVNVNYYEVVLVKAGRDMHKETWLNLKGTLNQLIQKSNTSERLFLEKLKQTYNGLSNYSPSTVRNGINYPSEISISEIKNLINCPSVKLDELENTLELISAYSNQNKGIRMTSIISEYLELLISNLLGELRFRQIDSCKLITKFEKKNRVKLLTYEP